MKAIALVVAGMLVGMTPAAAAAGELTVRLYNSARLDVSEMMTARAVAEPILREAGMDVRFRYCGSPVMPGSAVDRCNDALAPSEVVVRVIEAPHVSLTLQPEVFGVAHILKDNARGWLASLYSDRISVTELRLDLVPGTLLGRVLAHEVGHLLLSTPHHSETGLMRANWTDDIIHRDMSADWRFSLGEAASMQQMLVSVRGE
ncbi:MAG: hypothetical protein ABL986_13400 [Vicinamibacterales bacterium]